MDDEFVVLHETANVLAKVSADSKQNGQEQLELSKLLKSVTGENSHQYFLDRDETNWLPRLQSVDCTPVPQAIRSLYSQVECEMFMGLFPEINRAWISIDNKLFLWNYYEGEDFYVYTGIDQLIVSVGLARPQPGHFSSDVEYLLVISTPVEIVVLELVILGPEPSSGKVELRPTDYNIASDDVPMRCIVGTSTGRIFMGGHDGGLYELCYERPTLAHSIGFKRQCRKKELSGGLGKYLLPSFIRKHIGTSVPVRQLCVDHERSLVYSLTGNSTLDFYKFDGHDNIHRCKQANLHAMLKMFVDQQRRTNRIGISSQDLSKSKETRITKLQVVMKHESDAINLVCITDGGIRIFLRADMYHGIVFEHVRGPPEPVDLSKRKAGERNEPASSSLLAIQSQTMTAETDKNSYGIRPGNNSENLVTNAFYSDGVSLFATSDVHSSSMEDVLCGYSIDLGMRENQGRAALSPSFPPFKWQQSDFHEVIDENIFGTGPMLRQNSVTMDQLQSYSRGLPVGRIWDIAEAVCDPAISPEEEMVYSHMLSLPSLPVLSNSTGPISNKRTAEDSVRVNSHQQHTEALGLTELAKQHVLPRRYFIVLTAHGVWKLTKNQPINQLLSLLKIRENDREIEEFFKQYGLDESCAMCMNIACSTGDGRVESMSIAQRASRWISRVGYGVTNLQNDAKEERQIPCYTEQLQKRQGFSGMEQVSNSAAAMINPVGVAGGSGIIHSGGYSGLVLFTTRLFRLFWDWTLVIEDTSSLFRCRYTSTQIEFLVEPLGQLKRYLETEQPFSEAIREHSTHSSGAGRSKPGRFGMPQKPSAMDTEQVYVARIYNLINRAMQALLLFDVLQSGGVGFPTLISNLSHELSRMLCQGMTWCDFVTTIHGRVLASALAKSMVENTVGGNEIGVRLENQCPLFFSQGDAMQIAALESMSIAETSNNKADKDQNIQQVTAMFQTAFEKSAHLARTKMELAQSTLNTLRDACTKIERHGHASDSLSLVLFFGRTFATNVESLPVIMEENSFQKNEMYLREEAYNIGIDILSRFLRPPHQETTGEAKSLLNIAIGSNDALWHYTLYTWMLQQGLKTSFLSIESPYIFEFLGDSKANDPRIAPAFYEAPLHEDVHLVLRASWLNKHDRKQEAAAIMQRLAKFQSSTDTGSPTLDQRIYYLTKSIEFANAAKTSNNQFESLVDMSVSRDEIDVAKLQKVVLRALEALHSKCIRPNSDTTQVIRLQQPLREEIELQRHAIETLKTSLRNPSELYNDFAYRFGLWTACIDIMAGCDHNDEAELETLYTNVFYDAIQNDGATDLERIKVVLKCTLEELATQYSNKPLVFPCGFLVQGLEDLCTFYPEPPLWTPWVIAALLKIGLSFHVIFQAYLSYNQKIQMSAEPVGQKFLNPDSQVDFYETPSKSNVACAIIRLVEMWYEQTSAEDVYLNQCSKQAVEVVETLIDQISGIQRKELSDQLALFKRKYQMIS